MAFSKEERRKYMAEYRKKWYRNFYDTNRERILSNNKKWRDANLDKVNLYELSRSRGRVRVRDKDAARQYVKNRRAIDIEYKLRTYLSNRLRIALNKSLTSKRKDSVGKYIGCSMADFKAHIESKFLTGMNWGNYGQWHIDHIIPLKLFSLEREPCRFVAFHYSNMQPLWAADNFSKGCKYV